MKMKWAFFTLLLGASQYVYSANDCPLSGTWDTGFTSRSGSHQTRMIMSFDCNGRTTFQTKFLTGQVFSGAGRKYVRSGTYAIVGKNAVIPNAFDIDVVIDSYTLTFLDANSVQGAIRTGTDNSCLLPGAKLLTPLDVLGKSCSDIVFPKRGDIERAVVLVQGGQFVWSPFGGKDKIVIQSPGESEMRKNVVDDVRIFHHVEQLSP